MKGIVAEYPYDNYYLYVVYHKKEDRRYAVLVPIDKTNKNLKRTTISYARYLMSVKEKRILDKNEDVDHIDENRMNDNINNLQILSKTENIIKGNKRNGRRMVKLKCPNCGKIFNRRRKNTHLTSNKSKYTACSRKCSTTFGAIKQHYPDSDFVKRGMEENVVREYISFDD